MAVDTRQSYEECWKHPRWQQLRLKVFERDGWECVGCGDKEETLVAHQMRYCGLPYESPIEDLQTLCQRCHESLGQHPKGGIWFGCENFDGVDGQGCWGLIVEWCAICGSKSFADPGSNGVYCRVCKWCPASLGHEVFFRGECHVSDCQPASPAKTFSESTLKAYLTKARKAGLTDKKIAEILFRETHRESAFAVCDLVSQLTKARDSKSDEEEIATAVALVKARRILADAVSEQSAT